MVVVVEMGQTVVSPSANDLNMDGREWCPEDAQELVLNYLVYNCHQHTAAAFVREWLGDSPEAQRAISASAEWKSLEYRSRKKILCAHH